MKVVKRICDRDKVLIDDKIFSDKEEIKIKIEDEDLTLVLLQSTCLKIYNLFIKGRNPATSEMNINDIKLIKKLSNNIIKPKYVGTLHYLLYEGTRTIHLIVHKNVNEFILMAYIEKTDRSGKIHRRVIDIELI